MNKYNLLILHDKTRLVRGDADKIYTAVTQFSSTEKPILLILCSPGGSIGAGYFIGKLCQEYSAGSFIVAVPRQAKSAGTLICCAANEIHMGSMSELGPIDPQIDDLPALGLKNSIEHIAELVKLHPESSSMFAKFLSSSLTLIHLGYYERVAESAVQYAERLLRSHQSSLSNSAEKVANDLVYAYKDHGFVIDKSEATQIFGPETIKTQSDEYQFANTIYEFLDAIDTFASWSNHAFYFVGDPRGKAAPVFLKKGR